MNVLTIEKKIKSHTLQLDDTEVERYLNNTEEWIDVLHSLLTAKPIVEGNGQHAPAKSRGKRHHKTNGPGKIISCPKCGQLVKTRGLLIHQRGSKCRPQSGTGASTSLD